MARGDFVRIERKRQEYLAQALEYLDGKHDAEIHATKAANAMTRKEVGDVLWRRHASRLAAIAKQSNEQLEGGQ